MCRVPATGFGERSSAADLGKEIRVPAKNTYTALVLDLDGTLIGRDERIAPSVARAVSTVSAQLSVSIVTGREPADVLRFARS